MWKSLSFASLALLVAAGTASADTKPECTKGKEWITVTRYLRDSDDRAMVFSFRIYEGGVWQMTARDRDRDRASLSNGCLVAEDQKALATAFAAKPTFKTTPVQFVCDASAATVDDYTVDGSNVFTREMCPSTLLDDKSAKVIQAIDHAMSNRRAAK